MTPLVQECWLERLSRVTMGRRGVEPGPIHPRTTLCQW